MGYHCRPRIQGIRYLRTAGTDERAPLAEARREVCVDEPPRFARDHHGEAGEHDEF